MPSRDAESLGKRGDLQRRCESIEEAYEFMLAYAAQGVSGEGASQSAGPLRDLLTRAAEALTRLGDEFAGLIDEEGLEPAGRYRAYQAVVADGARRALAAVELVLAQRALSSQLIDNLNASVHLRTVLTDLFLIDEILKAPPQRG